MKKRKVLITGFVILAVAALIATVLVYLWYQGAFLPGWIRWQEKQAQMSDCSVILTDRTVSIHKDGEEVWASAAGVMVSDYLWCDIDHDDAPELMLLCWRIGRYGSARPFWVEKDEQTWSQHIYIYDWTGETIKAIWMASDIGMDALDWRFDEEERLVITETSGRQTAWDWVSWGLTLIREYE